LTWKAFVVQRSGGTKLATESAAAFASIGFEIILGQRTKLPELTDWQKWKAPKNCSANARTHFLGGR